MLLIRKYCEILLFKTLSKALYMLSLFQKWSNSYFITHMWMSLSISLLKMIYFIVWSIFLTCLSVTAVVLWLLSVKSWWSLEQRPPTLTGDTEALQCHCSWMDLTVVGESASCQNIWVRPHTAFKIVIVGLFLGIHILTVFYLLASFIAAYRLFSFVSLKAVADLGLYLLSLCL